MKKAIALVIDADNTTCKHLEFILQTAENFGNPIIRRAYGDFTSQNLACWGPLVKQYALRPVQKFSYRKGKNSTDIELIMDAMEFLWDSHITGLILVSGDSDYTSLAIRYRESGREVIVIADDGVSNALKSSCTFFIPLPQCNQVNQALQIPADSSIIRLQAEPLPGLKIVGKIELPESTPQNQNLLRKIIGAISTTMEEDGYSSVNKVIKCLKSQDPNFQIRQSGSGNWRKFIETNSALFEYELRKDWSNIFIKVKSN